MSLTAVWVSRLMLCPDYAAFYAAFSVAYTRCAPVICMGGIICGIEKSIISISIGIWRETQYANLCSCGAEIMLNLRNYANYALCSDSAIMPESNAGITGLAQVLRL